MAAERRATKRYTVHSDEIQVSIYPTEKIYSIKDISKGGLSIEYSPVASKPLKLEKIAILAIDYDRFYLQQITCKTVYDIAALMEGQSFKGGERRIRGLKFVELTKEQEEKLDSLLKGCFDRSA